MNQKSTVCYNSSRKCPTYPNSADANYYREKVFYVLAAILAGAGLTACIVLLVMFT